MFTLLPPVSTCSFPRRSRRLYLLDYESKNKVYVTLEDMDLTVYLSWTESCPVEHEGCQQQVATVKDECILAWDNVERGKTPNVWSVLSVRGLRSGDGKAK